MGKVYLARSPGGRPAAVKVINEHLRQDEQVMSRFRREVETLATVRSAYTAALIDAELTSSPYWLATEYVPGPTLHTAVSAEGPFPADLCRVLLGALAEGLMDIHVHGVWHRDIKPENVILSATGPQLIDFGIARTIGSANLTQVGSWVGSPGFLAPETITDGETGSAADVFALGATIAFAATGRPPYGDGPLAAVSYRSVHEDVDLSGVEPDLAGLISACMQRDPARRPDPQRIVEMAESRTDLVQHPAYQRALVSGTVGAPAFGTTVANAATTQYNQSPAHPATILATQLDSVPQSGPSQTASASASDLGPDSASNSASGEVRARRRRLPLVLAGAAALTVIAVAAGLLTLHGSGSGSRTSAGAKSSAVTGRAAGASKAPKSTASQAPPQASSSADGTQLPGTLVVKAQHRLTAGQFLQTRHTKMVMQVDGNLVVYDENGTARWASQTSGKGMQAVFQKDGNLVIYNADDKPVWATQTQDHEGAVLVLLQDGNVVIGQGSTVAWQTGTAH